MIVPLDNVFKATGADWDSDNYVWPEDFTFAKGDPDTHTSKRAAVHSTFTKDENGGCFSITGIIQEIKSK